MAATDWQELEGSPHVTINREGGSATREFAIPWGDISAFAALTMPSPPGYFGSNGFGSVPGWPGLQAQQIEFQPYSTDLAADDDGCRGAAGTTNDFNSPETGCKATVTYGPPTMDTGGGNQQGDQPEPPSQEDGQQIDYGNLVHSIHIGGQFMRIPNSGVQWVNPAPRADAAVARLVSKEVYVGKVVVTVEHTYRFSRIPAPLWSIYRDRLGCVNGADWGPIGRDRMLYLGLEGEWVRLETQISAPSQPSTRGLGPTAPAAPPLPGGAGMISPTPASGSLVLTGWQLSHKFSEKPEELKGWNFFYRPKCGEYELMVKKNGSLIFPHKDLKPILMGAGL